MTLSTPTLVGAADSAKTACQTIDWCSEHRETVGGLLIHLSDFEVGRNGTVTGIKAYSWADGEPTGGALVLVMTPPDSTRFEPWHIDALREEAFA